jgi:ComF family protein
MDWVSNMMKSQTNSLNSLISWINAGLGLFYPEWCQLCGHERAIPQEGFVCSSCQAKVRLIRPPFCHRCGLPVEGDVSTLFECTNCRDAELGFRFARSAVVARDPVLEAIHRYKYHRALWFEPFLAALLIRQALPELERRDWDWLVPIPLHPTKQREREFNQAERLARRLSAATRIPVQARLVRRRLPTRTQTLLTREEREANVANAFEVPARRQLKGQRIVLIDDVFTTGSTTSACAWTLLRAGASDVCVWTVARGI